MKALNILLDDKLYKTLRQFAFDQHISMAETVRRILASGLSKENYNNSIVVDKISKKENVINPDRFINYLPSIPDEVDARCVAFFNLLIKGTVNKAYDELLK